MFYLSSSSLSSQVNLSSSSLLPLLLLLLLSPLSLSPFVSYYYSQLSTVGSVVSTCAFTCVYLFLTIYPL